MKASILATWLAAAAFAGSAMAHTHLKSASPADGATVANSPAEFVLTFGEAARLTALSIQKDGGAEQKVAPLPTTATAQFKVPAPKLDNGHYTLNWRILGDDGHVMSGKVGFTVGGTPTAGAAPHEHHEEHSHQAQH
jgi:methionine-rich copper-binding protein CopC